MPIQLGTEEETQRLLLLALGMYLIIINVAAFIIMRKDKSYARQRGHRRISERRLLLTAFCGGSLGAYLAMRIYHHKTKHPRFAVGVPLMLALHIALVILWYRSGWWIIF